MFVLKFRVFDHFKWGSKKGKVNPDMFATIELNGYNKDELVKRMKTEYSDCATQIVSLI